jgi:hypothetical protein
MVFLRIVLTMTLLFVATEWSPQAAQAPQDRPAVLVNPLAASGHTARTIQEGVDMAEPGGTVLVLPAIYAETLTVNKGVTIKAIGGTSGDVIVMPPGAPGSTIEVATTEPVILHGLTVYAPGANGIRGIGPVDLTVESTSVIAINPPTGTSVLVLVAHDDADGRRARLVVRDSFIDGAISNVTPPPPVQSFGLRAQGDVDAVLERNTIRRLGGACIFAVTRADLAGELNVDILDNDLDECHPIGRVAAIIVGPVAMNQPSPTRPLTATGTVNVIGNVFRNSAVHCLNNAIAYEVYTGRIERNRIVDFVQPCATPTPRNLPGAIWIGRLSPFPFPAVTPSVQYNDIVGNAHTGLRIATNQTISVDASCNFWGSEFGPSGIGAGDGDAIVVQPGGAPPLFTPFAVAPVAGTPQPGC